MLVDGLPTTGPERTIADLIRDHHDLTHVATAIEDGHRSGILDMSKLSGKLEQVAHRTGHRDGPELLEYLLDLVGLSAAALTKSIAESAIGRFIATSAVQQYRDLIEGMPVPDMVPSTVQALKRAAILDVGPATAQALTNSAAPSIKSVGTLIGKNAALQAAMRDEVSRTRAKPMARSSAAETVAEDANGETDQ